MPARPAGFVRRGSERDDGEDTLLRRLERGLAESGLPLDEGGPLLASLLSLPIAGAPATLSWAPQRQRRRTIDGSRQIAEELLALAGRSGDETHALQAHHAMWPTCLARGEFATVLAHCTDGLALYAPERHHALAYVYGGHDAGVCGLGFAALSSLVLGDPERGRAFSQEALALARAQGHPHSTANAQAWASAFHLLSGDLGAAWALAESCRALDAEYGFPQWAAMARVMAGSARAAAGEPESGLDEMRAGIADWRATRASFTLTTYLALVAEAELGRGDAAAGRAVDEALTLCATSGERLSEAELHRLRGEILLASEAADPAEAEASVHRALDVAREQQARAYNALKEVHEHHG